MLRYLFLLFTMILNTIIIYGCSPFVLKKAGQVYLGKNFDWTLEEGMLIKNLRNTKKWAYFTHDGQPASWTSKYGSITFNQNGKEMPYGGMNEMGLVIEMLWLETAQYNIHEQKNYVNELEWIQYQLDNFSNVEDLLLHLQELKIYPIKGKVHYLAADASGNSVVIEYINGKPSTNQVKSETCQSITNHSVEYSKQYSTHFNKEKGQTTSHQYRYFLLDKETGKIANDAEITSEMAFNILSKVSIPKGAFKTMWSIVYNIQSKSISFFTSSNKKIKSVFLNELEFESMLTYIDLNQNQYLSLNNSMLPLPNNKNYEITSKSLMHLGFDMELTNDLCQHQFNFDRKTSSYYSELYFHMQITIPLTEDKQTGFIAVMSNEDDFKKKKAVTGGYLYGTVPKGTIILNIYGLKNGYYSMLAFIDDNKNRKLDFNKSDKTYEKFATFGRNDFTKEAEMNFGNTSAFFNKANSNYIVRWT